jgi:hypothetical protein
MKLLQDFYSDRHQFRIIAHPLSRPADGRTVLVDQQNPCLMISASFDALTV